MPSGYLNKNRGMIFWHIFFYIIHTQDRKTKKKEDEMGKYYQTLRVYCVTKSVLKYYFS
jgi:hypothetical protein